MQEVQRLTNNHVANLDVIISDLRHENAELGKTLTYLNGHEAVIFKVRRKLGQAFNRCYPKGTVRRKKLGYWKRTILHPGKMMITPYAGNDEDVHHRGRKEPYQR